MMSSFEIMQRGFHRVVEDLDGVGFKFTRHEFL